MSYFDSHGTLQLAASGYIPEVFVTDWEKRTGNNPIDVLRQCRNRRVFQYVTCVVAFVITLLMVVAPGFGLPPRIAGSVMLVGIAVIMTVAIFFKCEPPETFPDAAAFANAFSLFREAGGLRAELVSRTTPKPELRKIAHDMLVGKARRIIDWDDYNNEYPQPDGSTQKQMRVRERDQLYCALIQLDVVPNPHKPFFDEARRRKSEAAARQAREAAVS